jgi:hypothetical protein
MDLSKAEWCKSSWSSGDDPQCVEVATNLAAIVAVRDSKNPGGHALVFSRAEWRTFLQAVKIGNMA